jgi:predicted PurR-regulated permease PerM
MPNSKNPLYFLMTLLLASFVGVCIIFWPFVSVLILAVVLGVIFQPVHEIILKVVKNPVLSSILSTLIVILIIIGPVAWIVTRVVHEAFGLLGDLQSNNYGFSGVVNTLQDNFNHSFSYLNIDLKSYLAGLITWIAGHAGSIFSNALKTGLNIFLSVIALFYWFKDGKNLQPVALRLSPLKDEDDSKVINKLGLSIRSVIRGTLLVAIMQGILASIGFTIFGLPKAALWGSVAAISALIPGLGTSIVLIPAVIFMFLSGHTAGAIGLLIWSVLAVGLIDNFLGPKLMSRKSDVHPFFILISVLGGIHVLGPIGFLAGPIVLSFFFALLDIYSLYQEKKI